MLRAILREYLGTEELSRHSIPLDIGGKPITIGRSPGCTYQIGDKFNDLSKWVARIQATILDENGCIKLVDGVKGKASTNGVYCHAERIEGAIVLTPGLQLTIFKADRAKVTLDVTDSKRSSGTQDELHGTYTGEDLLDRLQEKVEAIGEQVELLGEQLAQREAIDSNQERRLILIEKRFYRLFALVFGFVAVIVLVNGWTGGSAEDKKQWTSTLTAIAIGSVAAYLKSKENQSEKLTQRT